jgi:hypothetical protein
MPVSPEGQQSKQQALQRPTQPDFTNKGARGPKQNDGTRGQGNGRAQISFSFHYERAGQGKKKPAVLA